MNFFKLFNGFGRRSKTKEDDMTDLYKLIADMICNSIDDKWEKAVVEIESSLGKMLSTNAYYFSEDGHQNAFGLINDNQDEDLGENIFELQESMYPEHKWNRAVYTLEKNGHFDMAFEWNQALQDEWDKA